MPVTVIEKLQVALGASVAPARLADEEPALAVIVPPPHVPTRPLGVATTKPAGSASVNPIALKAIVAFAFVMWKVNVVLPLSGTLAAPKVFVRIGGAPTVSDALDVLPVPAVMDVTDTLLFFTPAVVAVTFTLKVHDPFGARVAADKLAVPDPAVAVIVPPPQVPA